MGGRRRLTRFDTAFNAATRGPRPLSRSRSQARRRNFLSSWRRNVPNRPRMKRGSAAPAAAPSTPVLDVLYGRGVQRPEALTFGEAAELYDRVRPGYPDAVFDAVLSAVPGARRALDAGAGTGRATVALAERGVAVEAVEPDSRMAALARTRCAGLPVRIRETRFEDWQGAAGTFNLVVCAQAWHWLDHA